MLVDDGFSVLDTDCGIIGERKAVNEVKVVKVPIGQIFPNPYQPRKSFDEAALEELSASIAQYGVLQPLLCSINVTFIAYLPPVSKIFSFRLGSNVPFLSISISYLYGG